MKLSVVIPAYNEEAALEGTVRALYEKLMAESIEHEIVVIDDNSTDRSPELLDRLSSEIVTLRAHRNLPPNGFGFAVRKGIQIANGDAVAIYMADASDRPTDLVAFYRALIAHDVDCVFGTRFHPKAEVIDYPWLKLILNRSANAFIQLLFGIRYNDVTNAFKLYRRHVLEGLTPFLSHHFNLTVELPLKAIVRGYTYTVIPNHWINRKTGLSKLKIREMGSRYLFIILYCFIERWLSRGDYRRETNVAWRKASAKG